MEKRNKEISAKIGKISEKKEKANNRKPQSAKSIPSRNGSAAKQVRTGENTQSPAGSSKKAVPFDRDFFLSYTARAFEKNGIPADMYFTDLQKEKYAAFFRLLFEVNAYTNLTSIRSVPEAIVKHLVDSLTIAPFLPQNAKVLDVGCGGGFPSLPLAIARPDLTIISLDSTAKKIAFVDQAVAALELCNITTLTARAEEYAYTSARSSFDCVVSRAVANMTALSEITLPFVRKNGFVLAMKGPGGREELAAAAQNIKILGGDTDQTVVHTLSLRYPEISAADHDATSADLVFVRENEERILLKIPKIKETPHNYPRVWAQILKSAGTAT